MIGADDEGIEAIYQDADNQLWVGTALNGLKKYQRPRIQAFDDFNGKALGYVGAVYGDSFDRLWFGTPGGLRQIENGVIRDLSLSDKIPGNVRTITEDASGNFGSAAMESTDMTRENSHTLQSKTVYRPITFFR